MCDVGRSMSSDMIRRKVNAPVAWAEAGCHAILAGACLLVMRRTSRAPCHVIARDSGRNSAWSGALPSCSRWCRMDTRRRRAKTVSLLREVCWRIRVMCRAGGHVIVKAEYRQGPGLCVLLGALGWHRGRGGVWPDRHVFGRGWACFFFPGGPDRRVFLGPESVAGFWALLLSVS